MSDPAIPETFASAIFRKAIETGRSSELLMNLFEGGSVTLDVTTGDLIMFSPALMNDIVDNIK